MSILSLGYKPELERIEAENNVRTTFKKLLTSAWIICLCATSGSAVSLSYLIDHPEALPSAGNLTFDSFGWACAEVDASLVDISVVGSGASGDLFGIKIDFNGNFVAPVGIGIDGLLTYAVHAGGTKLLTGIFQAATFTGTAMANIAETATGQPDPSSSLFQVDLQVGLGFAQLASGSIQLPSPVQTLFVSKDFYIQGMGGLVSVETDEQRFSVPEASSTLKMLSLAVCGLFFISTRSIKRKFVNP